MSMVKFSLEEVIPRIYHLHFDSQYALAMHFLRAQEYYESPKFRGKRFTIVEFMEWYSKEHGNGAFTYPNDWTGFNVPSTSLLEVYGKKVVIPDPNYYDEFMQAVVGYVDTHAQRQPFYLIGTYGDNPRAFDHEMAHGLYFVDATYRQDMVKCLKDFRIRYPETWDRTKEILREMGYHEDVLEDEMQAYYSTGLCTELESLVISSNSFEKVFETAFQKHSRRGA